MKNPYKDKKTKVEKPYIVSEVENKGKLNQKIKTSIFKDIKSARIYASNESVKNPNNFYLINKSL